VAWLGLATPTIAAPIFMAGNDLGVTNTATQYWDAIQGTPNLASTTVDSTTGNTHSIEISAGSGSAEYVGVNVSSASTLVASMRLRVPTSSTPPSVRRKVLSFVDTGASKTGCMVTLEADETDSSTFRLKALYESADNTGGECSASATQDGKECTTAADCDYVNPGESSCAPGVYASTLALAKGTWYVVTLQQTNGTGEVTCALWQGTAGSSPAAYQRGAQTRDQGICTGGSVAGNACDDSSDCTGGGSCTTTDVVTIEQVRFGTDDTEVGALTYLIDDLKIDDSADAHPNYWIQTLVPTSDGTAIQWSVSGCTSSSAEYDCINDATPDDDGTYANSATDGEVQQANVTDITLAGGESVLAVAAVAVARSAGSSSPMFTGLTTTDGTSKSSSYDTNTVGTTYHLVPPYVLTDPPGAPTSWTETLVDGVQFYAEVGVGGGTIRMTQARVEALIDQADPPVPTVIPDRNQDGEDTVCLVGDSTFNDSGFHDLVVGGLIEPTNVLDCARGGATAGDVADVMSVAGNNNDILDGGSTQYVSCRALKGTLKPCDVVVLEIGVNTLHTGVTADPANDTTENGTRVPGFCDNKGGANDQGACVCPAGTGSRGSNYSGATAARYCRTKGADWLTTCTVGADCACSASAECCADCADTSCAACTTSTGVCSGSICTCTGLGCLGCNATQAAQTWSSSCVPGCLDSPQCPGGLCIAHESNADLMNEMRLIESHRAARPTPTPAATPSGTSGLPIIVYAAPPPGQVKNLLGCWQDIERSVGNYRTSLLAYAQSLNAPWIDMYGAMLTHCPGGQVSGRGCRTDGCTWNGTTCLYDRGCCLRDEIHWNDLGFAVAADAIIACLTNDGGTSGATWDCDFLGAP
jgi:hypothetical protein